MSKTVLNKEVLTDLTEMLRPEHTALLVVDVQNDFCSPGGALEKVGVDVGSAQAILTPLQQLIDRARAAGVQIINIRMTLYPDGHTNSQADLARRMGVWEGVPLATLAGTWGHENPPALNFAADDWVVYKYRNNAFIGTNLDLLLRANGIRSVIVTGTATQACVLETALMAQGMDYYVLLPTDCVASGSEELHQAGLAVLRAVLHKAGLTTADEITANW